MRDEKKQQKEALKEEMLRLGNLQRECKEEKIPVYITFDGYDGAGKGVQIGRLMQALDPRGFDVYTGDKDTEEEALRPFLWRFAVHAPAEGRITIYDTSWYRRVQADRFEGKLNEKKADAAFEDICAFERCLVDGGTFSLNFFWIFPRRNRKSGLKNFWNQRIPHGASQRKNLREMPITENIRSSAMR